MKNKEEMSRIEQLLENLKETTARINNLIEMFVTRGSETGIPDQIALAGENLNRIWRRIAKDADHLELTLEIFGGDRYLEWLLKVPASSPLFERRRAQVRDHRPAKSN